MARRPSLSAFKIWLLFVFLGYSLSAPALHPYQPASYFAHLQTVNGEWAAHPAACPPGTVTFSTDRDRIQQHLFLVIDHLRANAPAGLTGRQQANRDFLLTELRRYAERKVFPINAHHPGRRPYCVDAVGAYCAVGQMMHDSGHEDLVTRISAEHNYDYLADIRTEGLTAWADEHGFTSAELR